MHKVTSGKHKHIYAWIQTDSYIDALAKHMHINTNTLIHRCTHKHMHTQTYTNTIIHTCTHRHRHACAHIQVYRSAHTHDHTHTQVSCIYVVIWYIGLKVERRRWGEAWRPHKHEKREEKTSGKKWEPHPHTHKDLVVIKINKQNIDKHSLKSLRSEKKTECSGYLLYISQSLSGYGGFHDCLQHLWVHWIEVLICHHLWKKLQCWQWQLIWQCLG